MKIYNVKTHHFLQAQREPGRRGFIGGVNKEETRNVKHWKREITKLKLEVIPGEEVEELTNYFATEEGRQELEELNEEGMLILFFN